MPPLRDSRSQAYARIYWRLELFLALMVMRNVRQILLADDDAEDALVIQLALKRAGAEDPVHVVTSSEEVIAFMNGEGEYANRALYPLPTLVVLAIRLPLLRDFRALRWIRQRPQYNAIGVVVLSGVEYDNERAIAHELGADRYIVMPSDFWDLVNVAHRIRQRWLDSGGQQAAA
jgi:CheY-like chemotaxis protein